MKHLALALFLAAGMFGVAAADNMQSQSSMMAMPKCASGDPVVGVNTSTKMYMTQDQMKAKTAGMSDSQKQAMMTKNHMKMMCKSQADSMGAKMMKPPM